MCGAGVAAVSAAVARRTVRERDQVLAAHDRLDAGEALAVDLDQPLVGNALLLQFADHVAVVGSLPAVLPCDHGRQRLHLVASLRESEQRPVHELVRVHGDPELLEVVGIDLRRQQVARACVRQHRGAHPLAVTVNLRAQPCEVLLPAVQAALLQQITDAAHVLLLVLELLLDLERPRRGERRIVQSLLHARASQHGDRLEPRLRTVVTLQSQQRRRVALLRHALVEQCLEADEQGLREIEVRQQQAVVQLESGALIPRGLEQDLQVLFHARVGFVLECRGELRRHGIQIRLLAAHVSGLEVANLAVMSLYPDGRSALRRVFHDHLQQAARVGVARGDPRRRVAHTHGCPQARRGEHESSAEALHDVSPCGRHSTAKGHDW
jgi:hypothetical protein